MVSLNRDVTCRLTSVILCSSIDGTTNYHENTAKNDARLASITIGDCRDCKHGKDGADSEHVGKKTEKVRLLSNVIEITLPVVVLLQKIEEGSDSQLEFVSA